MPPGPKGGAPPSCSLSLHSTGLLDYQWGPCPVRWRLFALPMLPGLSSEIAIMASGNPPPQNPQEPVYAEKKLKKPDNEMLADIMKHPEVKKQADLLKMPLEEYAKKVLDYAKHPDKPPHLVITSDEDLKKQAAAAGTKAPPTQEELEDYLKKINSGEVAVSPAHQRDGFRQSEAGAPSNFGKALGSDDSLKGKNAEPTKNVDVKKDSTFKP
jgi:hypothetical protein